MKKKMFLALAIAATTLSAHAQNVYEGSGLTDNWYISMNAGGLTPTTHSAFWKGMRFTTGFELGKQVTPVLGLSFEAMTAINTTQSSTFLDQIRLNMLGKINLNNLFWGYRGVPRLFEVEAVGGIGWGHDPMNQATGVRYSSYLNSKFGASLNFNLGESKAWTVSMKPAIVYRMNGEQAYALNANKSQIELLAGVTYHFRNSNGKHYMTLAQTVDSEELELMNERINVLRRVNAEKDAALAVSLETIEGLQGQLDLADAMQQGPVRVQTLASLQPVITFGKDETEVSASQQPVIERLARYLKDNDNATLEINGYASPEGTEAVNVRISQERAEAVKKILVEHYGISNERVSASGQGVGNEFSKPVWNRATVIMLNGR